MAAEIVVKQNVHAKHLKKSALVQLLAFGEESGATAEFCGEPNRRCVHDVLDLSPKKLLIEIWVFFFERYQK